MGSISNNGNGRGDPTPQEILATARRYVTAGLSVIPIKTDGSKTPAANLLPKVFDPEKQREKPTWKPFQSRYATDEELRQWSRNAIAIVCGKISGNLEVIDNDSLSVWPQWCDLVKQHKPGLLERLVIVRTPSDCHHALYRCVSVKGNQPLARRLVVVPEGTEGAKLYKGSAEQYKGKWITTEILFETRGEGGYIVAPGSPLSVHLTGKPYRFIQGDESSIPTITTDERELLLSLAAAFDEMPKEPDKAKSNGQAAAISPGDDYNLRGDPAAILVKHGWTLTQRVGVIEYYKRPGKDKNGHSASLHAIGHNNFYCFSTAAAPFEPERKYDAFGVYARLECDGDTGEAARRLAGQGYGTPSSNGKHIEATDDNRRVPTNDELRDRWMERYPDTVFMRDDFYRYSDGLWRRLDKKMVKKELDEIICAAKAERIRPSGSLLTSVLTLAQAKAAECDDKFDHNPDYLVCRNGALHIPTLTLGPHRKDLYATTGVNFDYDPNAKRAAWDRYIEWLKLNVCEDAEEGEKVVEFLQEFAGLCLTTNMQHEISIWLVGEPGGGKSTFIEGIKTAISDRTVKLGLYEIVQRFGCANLPGKTLATCSEQPSDYMQSTCRLNEIISGETINIERKYHDAYPFTPTVKLLFAMNDPPRINDPNNGIFRRVAVVKIPSIDPADRDTTLKDRIKMEGPGVLNWCLEGLKRLNHEGFFRRPLSVIQATAEYQSHADVPGMFLAECTDRTPNPEDVFDPDYREQSSVLYNAYKAWCMNNGHKFVSSTRIVSDWKRLKLVQKTVGGLSYWYGICLNQNAPTTVRV